MYKLSLIAFLTFAMVFYACKSNKTIGSEKAEKIFSLSTTPCFGPCPVYEVSLYGDKLLTFNGKQHTELEGKYEKKLSDEQFEALLGIIEATDWEKLESNYTSDLTDLPTQNFSYNRRGLVKNVSKYGTEPKELNTMSDLVLEFVEEQVFND